MQLADEDFCMENNQYLGMFMSHSSQIKGNYSFKKFDLVS